MVVPPSPACQLSVKQRMPRYCTSLLRRALLFIDFKAILETFIPRRGRESNMSKRNTKKVDDKFTKNLKVCRRMINYTSALVQVATLLKTKINFLSKIAPVVFHQFLLL